MERIKYFNRNASTVGAIDLNFIMKDDEFFKKLQNNEFKLLYFVGSDNSEFNKKDEFIIYQGSHGDKRAQIADIILPSPAYTEQNGLFINLEGRLQKCLKASYPPGSSKEDWKIFNSIYKKIRNNFLFKNFQELRKDTLNKIKEHSNYDLLPNTNLKIIGSEKGDFFDEDIVIDQTDYYFSNAIARSSKTMSDCKNERNNKNKN